MRGKAEKAVRAKTNSEAAETTLANSQVLHGEDGRAGPHSCCTSPLGDARLLRGGVFLDIGGGDSSNATRAHNAAYESEAKRLAVRFGEADATEVTAGVVAVAQEDGVAIPAVRRDREVGRV